MDRAQHLEDIVAAGRRIHEAIDTIDLIVSARLGVHRSDLRCLHMLESGPATPGDVAAKTGLTSGSVTALLDRLENAGFIERQRSVADRRSIEVALPECRAIEMRAIYDEIKQAIRIYFQDRPIDDVADTAKALAMFAEALGDYADAGFAQVKCPGG